MLWRFKIHTEHELQHSLYYENKIVCDYYHPAIAPRTISVGVWFRNLQNNDTFVPILDAILRTSMVIAFTLLCNLKETHDCI